MDKSSSLGIPTHPKKYPGGTSVKAWGCPRGTPSSLAKIRSHFKTLYFYCFMHYVFFLERIYFTFQFYLFLFAAINGWTPTNFFCRRCTHFHLPRTHHFSLLSFNECSLFLELRLAFVFRLDFCSDLVLYLHQGIFGPLVYVGIHQKRLFQKGSNGVGKEKKFHAKKSGTKRSLFRLRLRLFHVMLDVILIVCLVIFSVA
jgi:hypothetical protein